MSSRLQNIIKIVISIVALAAVVFALRGVNLAESANILLGANPWFLLVALLGQAMGIVVRVWRWKYQLRPVCNVSPWSLISAMMVSIAVGNVTITGVGAVPRIYLVNRRTGIDGGFIAGTWVQEYLLDATVLTFWAAMIPLWVKLPPQFQQVQYLLVFLLAATIVIDVLFWRRRGLSLGALGRSGLGKRVRGLLPGAVAGKLDTFSDGCRAALYTPSTLVMVVLITLITWALEAFIFWALILSLNIPFTYLQATAVMAFTHVVIGIPSVPGFIGTLEAATAGLALALGADQASALAYAVLLRVYFVGPSTVVGAVFAWREGLRLWGAPQPMPSTPIETVVPTEDRAESTEEVTLK